MGVGGVVVEFFCTVCVAEVTPAFRADGVVTEAVGREGWSADGKVWFFDLGGESGSVVVGVRGEAAQFHQGGKEAGEVHGARADLARALGLSRIHY